jgi:hypothetical protein
MLRKVVSATRTCRGTCPFSSLQTWEQLGNPYQPLISHLLRTESGTPCSSVPFSLPKGSVDGTNSTCSTANSGTTLRGDSPLETSSTPDSTVSKRNHADKVKRWTWLRTPRIPQQSCGIANCCCESRARWRAVVRDRKPERPPIASPVMNRCLYDLRGPRLPHGGVGGANSMSQPAWRLAPFAPTPPGTDTAVLPV